MNRQKETTSVDKWRDVITPKVPFLYFPYKLFWQQRFLIYLFVKQQILTKYKQTILGPAWAIAQPLLSTVIFTLVFNRLLNFSTGTVPPLLFYLLGNTLWLFFASSFMMISNFLVSNAPLLTKVYLVKQLIPVAHIIFNLCTSVIQFSVFLVIWGYYVYIGTITPNVYMFIFPVAWVILTLFALGCGYLFAAAAVKYRDLTTLYAYILQSFLYLTPLIYTLQTVADEKRFWLQLNPLTAVFEAVRYGFFGEGFITWGMMLYSLGASLFIFMLGVFALSRVEKVYADVI